MRCDELVFIVYTLDDVHLIQQKITVFLLGH